MAQQWEDSRRAHVSRRPDHALRSVVIDHGPLLALIATVITVVLITLDLLFG